MLTITQDVLIINQSNRPVDVVGNLMNIDFLRIDFKFYFCLNSFASVTNVLLDKRMRRARIEPMSTTLVVVKRTSR